MTVDRKAALAAYKERRVPSGIFAVRCAASGQLWLGRAADLASIRNRLWFALGLGNFHRPAMQAAWNEHGESCFSFEVVERLDTESGEPVDDIDLKRSLAHWRDAMGADAV